MPELVADRHSRPAADIYRALLNHEESGRRGGPRVDVNPEAHQRRRRLGITLASAEGPDVGALLSSEAEGRLAEGLERLSDLRASRRARVRNQR